MEGKKSKNIGSPSSSSSSSLISQIFGSSGKSSTSNSNELFNSVSASRLSIGGREHSSRDSAGGSRNQSINPTAGHADGISRGGQNRGGGTSKLFSNEGNSILQGEKIDPCPLSSSLYYGGQDICNQTNSNSRYNSSNNRTYSNNGEESTPTGSPIDSRGDWWKGSLYY